MDLDILLRNASTSDLERVSKTARRMKPAGIAIDRLWFDAESVKRDIRETMGSKVEEESIMHAGDMVSPFFVGMNFGDARKIREVRRELIEELSKTLMGSGYGSASGNFTRWLQLPWFMKKEFRALRKPSASWG